MSTTTTKLVSGYWYMATSRNGARILIGDWDASGDRREEIIVREWKCRHGGVRTGEAGDPNVDHGSITITLLDGSEVHGEYEARDSGMSVRLA